MGRFDANYDPTADQIDRIEAIRNGFMIIEEIIEQFAGTPREKALALTNLEQASHWAIRSVSGEPKA